MLRLVNHRFKHRSGFVPHQLGVLVVEVFLPCLIDSSLGSIFIYYFVHEDRKNCFH